MCACTIAYTWIQVIHVDLIYNQVITKNVELHSSWHEEQAKSIEWFSKILNILNKYCMMCITQGLTLWASAFNIFIFILGLFPIIFLDALVKTILLWSWVDWQHLPNSFLCHKWPEAVWEGKTDGGHCNSSKAILSSSECFRQFQDQNSWSENQKLRAKHDSQP